MANTDLTQVDTSKFAQFAFVGVTEDGLFLCQTLHSDREIVRAAIEHLLEEFTEGACSG
jgi:hypothetical protein